jgi:hypothetical protein
MPRSFWFGARPRRQPVTVDGFPATVPCNPGSRHATRAIAIDDVVAEGRDQRQLT